MVAELPWTIASCLVWLETPWHGPQEVLMAAGDGCWAGVNHGIYAPWYEPQNGQSGVNHGICLSMDGASLSMVAGPWQELQGSLRVALGLLGTRGSA